MALPSSGTITFLQLQTELGGSNPISLSEYYRGGAIVNSSVIGPNIPSSGAISLSNFYGAYVDVRGQAEYTTGGTYTWTCPSGVTSVSVVCVGGGGWVGQQGPASSFSGAAGTLTANGGGWSGNASGTTLGSSLSTGTVGGGNGGAPGGYPGRNGAGGGAGGYGGSGGNGGSMLSGGAGGGGVGIYGGSGGGGGGGYGPNIGTQTRGAGASGGTGGGSDVVEGGIYGGGAGWATGGYYPYAGGGGALRYVTSYATVPGNNYTVTVGATSSSYGGKGAVRIIWGSGRAYPNTNTANV